MLSLFSIILRRQLQTAVLLIGLMCLGCHGNRCKTPSPAEKFNYEAFIGVWYEIGKIQTASGAFLQRNCICSTMTVDAIPNGATGDSYVEYSCRNKTPTGRFNNITTVIERMDPPGKWVETFFPRIPQLSNSLDYTIIKMDVGGESYAVLYNCSDDGNNFYYCTHIFSRSSTMEPALRRQLVREARDLGLDPLDRPYDVVVHNDACFGN